MRENKFQKFNLIFKCRYGQNSSKGFALRDSLKIYKEEKTYNVIELPETRVITEQTILLENVLSSNRFNRIAVRNLFHMFKEVFDIINSGSGENMYEKTDQALYEFILLRALLISFSSENGNLVNNLSNLVVRLEQGLGALILYVGENNKACVEGMVERAITKCKDEDKLFDFERLFKLFVKWQRKLGFFAFTKYAKRIGLIKPIPDKTVEYEGKKRGRPRKNNIDHIVTSPYTLQPIKTSVLELISKGKETPTKKKRGRPRKEPSIIDQRVLEQLRIDDKYIDYLTTTRGGRKLDEHAALGYFDDDEDFYYSSNPVGIKRNFFHVDHEDLEYISEGSRGFVDEEENEETIEHEVT